MKWQPIETAPKDGTRIIIWLGNPFARAEMVCWYERWKVWTSDPEHISDYEISGIGCDVPTHWMPLPAAPEATP